MVLLKVRLEGAVGAGTGRLITKGRASASHEVGIVVRDVLLATPNAPANDGKTAEENSTPNTANDTTDNLLIRWTQTAAAVVAAPVAQACWVCHLDRASGDNGSPGSS